MRVLLCSPYLKEEGIHRGGINIWADNILQYYMSLGEKADVLITPVSFDRRHYISVDTCFFKRIWLGIKELSVAIKNVEREISLRDYDIIHICTSASISLFKDLMLLRISKKYGVRAVLHLHFGRTPDLIKKKNWEWRLLNKAISLADSVVSMDMCTYSSLHNQNIEHVCYCPNPLSMEIMEQIEKERDSIRRRQNKLLFVGHVLPSKGVYELVKAAKEFQGIELHIVGKAQDLMVMELKKIASEYMGGSWLRLRGELSHADVLRELMSSTIFVFPSHTEGFPNVILEAMACGCPIAASSVGAIPEMLNIDAAPCGICYQPFNQDQISESIDVLLKDNKLREKYSQRANERVYDEYSIQVVWLLLVDIWKTIKNK